MRPKKSIQPQVVVGRGIPHKEGKRLRAVARDLGVRRVPNLDGCPATRTGEYDRQDRLGALSHGTSPGAAAELCKAIGLEQKLVADNPADLKVRSYLATILGMAAVRDGCDGLRRPAEASRLRRASSATHASGSRWQCR